MDGLFSLFDLNMPEELKNISKEELINGKKFLNSLLGESRERAKLNKCYYCGNECNSFCNSHTIPQFCLKNIAVNGKVSYINSILGMPAMKEEKGINEAGVFHMICRDCDSKIFKDYETPENYNDVPTIKMLAQMDMKNNLKNISKRLIEIEIYNIMKEKFPASNEFAMYKNEINSMDLNEFENSYKNAKRVDLKPSSGEYYIGYYNVLPYVAPIAYQGNIALVADLNGDIINDIYNMESQYVIKNLSICIFPFRHTSVIMLFVEKNNRRYSKFFRQLKKLSLEDQLSVINFILFAYSEDYYLSPVINKEITDQLCEVAGKTTDIFADASTNKSQHLEATSGNYDYNARNTIPNLLSEKYAINKEEEK